MKNKVGRPTNPEAMKKTGKAHTFWVDRTYEKKIEKLMQKHKVGFTELMRELIEKADSGGLMS